jgi:TonB-linked SusC/RagA family outer membrane protein
VPTQFDALNQSTLERPRFAQGVVGRFVSHKTISQQLARAAWPESVRTLDKEVPVSWKSRWLGGFMLLPAVLAASAAAQTGSITGQVLDGGTRQPVPGAQVYLDGTGIGTLTQADGRYRLTNIPPGTYALIAQVIGYSNGRRENLRVGAAQTVIVNFELSTIALKLTEVVVTGTVDPVSGVKVPFSVGKVTKADLAVPARTAATAIQGKVAGVRVVRPTGQPGSGAEILLRGVKSLERNNDPLIVVDGVILGESLVDIDAGDIESVEIVKGAAAASLYGSRASAGVVQITTSRGRNLPPNQTRITVRSEIGRNQLVVGNKHITQHHHYLVDPVKGYVDRNGNPVEKNRRVTDADLIADNPYPGPLYDHLAEFFDPGLYTRNSVSIGQSTPMTNFMASFNMSDDRGVVPNNDGSQLYGVRVNLDHRLRSDLNFSVSSYYSRYRQEDFGGGDVFYDIMFMPPDVDLRTPNEDGEPFIIRPDPFTQQENPLYNIWKTDNWDERSRVMGSVVARYAPANWFNLEGNLSFDRSDRHDNSFTPKGTKNLTSTSAGSVNRNNSETQAVNGGLTAAFLRSFGDLTVRTKGQFLLERESNDFRNAGGNTLAVVGVPDVDVAINEEGSSNTIDVRSMAVSALTGFDYQGKYIVDGLVRRDGSSLFGPNHRWATYYRASAAWRMSQEPWWKIAALNEFKLRYSLGTAGGRPNFADRFETWNVSGAGTVSKGVLGNRDLRPELQTEQEFGLDFIALNRFEAQLTYAKSKVEDQLLNIPLAAYFGYGSRWENAGTVESNTWEATLNTTLIQRENLSLSVGLVADRSRSRITKFDRGCYRTDNAFYYCAGVRLGTMYGYKFVSSLAEAPAAVQAAADQFAVNDDGLLVYVGAGNAYTDGLAGNLWGTRATIGGTTYNWGLPFVARDSADAEALLPIGDGNPDFNLGFTSHLTVKGVSLSMLWDAKFGGDIYNNTRQWGYRDNTHADYDQVDKPDPLKKPVTYYQALYKTNSTTSWFVDDGSFIKLRELALNYTLKRDQISSLIGDLGIERLGIGLIGRNLLTVTDYFGFDPEVGTPLVPYDGFDYPNFRNFTVQFDVVF